MNPQTISDTLAANIEYALQFDYIPFKDLSNLFLETAEECGGKYLDTLFEKHLTLLYNRIKEKQEAEAKKQQKLTEA